MTESKNSTSFASLLCKGDIIRAAVSAVMVWLLPFLISFLFYSEKGLSIPEPVFKSIMIVCGALFGSIFLIWYFKNINSGYMMHGIFFGLFVMILNWIFDLIVLCGMFGNDITTWFLTVGMRYFMIAFMAISVGVVAEKVHNMRP